MKSWWTKLSQRRVWLREPRNGTERWLFLRALALGVWVSILTRFRWSILTRFLERHAVGKVTVEDRWVAAERQRVCVEAALAFGGPLVRPGCLVRGLTLYYFLRRDGVPVSLCFGIPRRGTELTNERGHCWLERDGQPWAERSDPRAAFLPIHRLPRPPEKEGAAAEGTGLAGGRIS